MLVIGFINSFQVFTQAYIMTEGGPADSTLFYVLYLYRQAFNYFKMGVRIGHGVVPLYRDRDPYGYPVPVEFEVGALWKLIARRTSNRMWPGRNSVRSSAPTALRLLETSLVHVILVIGALAFIFPFYWLIITSIKSNAELFIWPPTLIPRTVELFHYGDALQEVPILRYMGNSTYLTVLNLIGVLISSSLVAFGFTRYHVPGSRILFAALLATMMLPHHVTMIPLFLVFRALGWVDTFRPLWVPAFLGNAFFIFLLRQFFASIPSELFDAARIDGSSEFGQYWRIMLPLSKPALTTVAIFQFQWTWNDFLNP